MEKPTPLYDLLYVSTGEVILRAQPERFCYAMKAKMKWNPAYHFGRWLIKKNDCNIPMKFPAQLKLKF